MSSPALDDRVGKVLAEEGTGRAGVSILNLRYGLEDKPGPVPAVLFGLQHVLVMFTAMIAAPLVIGQLLNLSPELRTTMVTGSFSVRYWVSCVRYFRRWWSERCWSSPARR
jgi:hypothetical protein